jgi:membrane fusion protein (multidrug efflux system)
MKLKASAIPAAILAATSLSLPACTSTHAEEHGPPHGEEHKIVVTTPEVRDVVVTQPYVCQIRARKYTEIKALQEGYLEEITVKEGQAVKQGDVMFKVMPVFYKARLAAEKAEAQFARVELLNTQKLHERKVVSDQEVALYEAKLAKAEAKVALAEAELKFTEVTAKFDGIMDRLYQQQGSLVGKGDLLTTLSDNSVMWVYFNVPEARYLEYKARQGFQRDASQLSLADSRIELVLADGNKFDQSPGTTVTIEGQFNNETGNIQFRADFPNPYGLLRHGQTGTVLMHRSMKNAVVIPQRATFELLDKQYVWVLGEDHVAHRRPITIAHELEDIYVIKSGLDVKDKIVLEGVRQVRDGEKVEYEFRKSHEALTHQKQHAE